MRSISTVTRTLADQPCHLLSNVIAWNDIEQESGLAIWDHFAKIASKNVRIRDIAMTLGAFMRASGQHDDMTTTKALALIALPETWIAAKKAVEEAIDAAMIRNDGKGEASGSDNTERPPPSATS